MTDARKDHRLTHVRADGSAQMVDVSAKPSSARTAKAVSTVVTTPEVTALLITNGLSKVDALGTARIAGIMAAKRTSELVPLCHPLPIAKVAVDVEPNIPEQGSVLVTAEVKTTGQTGVEMEALTAASVAALTLYDMIKGVDRAAVIAETKVVSKTGGTTGEWSQP